MASAVNPSFRHDSPTTPEAAWEPFLRDLPAQSASGGPLVVLAAHPDDETLGAGGLIAASARLGARVTVVVASDGEASHPQSPTRTPAALAALRRAELCAAVARLAPSANVHCLGLPDGRLDDYPESLDAALAMFVDSPAVRLVAPFRDDGHPDHDACGRAAARVAQLRGAELWEYPVWTWHRADPADDAVLPRERCRVLQLDEACLAAKRAALDEHASQHRPLSPQPGDEEILTAAMLTHFERTVECFVMPPPAASGAYFDALYSQARDPWGLDARFYEQRKRAVLLGSLPRPRFRRAFEPGCATGALTEWLSERADEVIAWDVAGAAAEQAAARVAAHDHVHVAVGQIPAQWPSGRFDLVVLSEVGYYCEDLALLEHRVRDGLADDGVLVACHWRHPAADHPRTADEVHDALGRTLHRDVHHVEADFVLDVWSRAGRSVAELDGLR